MSPIDITQHEESIVRSTVKKRNRSGRLAGLVGTMALMTLAVAPMASADEPNPTLNVDYDAVGSSFIGASVNATLPIGPSVLEAELDLVTSEIVGGSLAIPSKVLEFSIFGIPAKATVTLTQVGELTGELITTGLGEAKLTSNVAYDIRLSNVQAKVFGVWFPLAVGSNCHTKNPAQISVATPEGGVFTVGGGGPVEGTYTIGQFTGCTPLNFFDIPGFFPWFGSVPINALVPGSNNTISLMIDNPRFGG